jgi:hypothetical protein
VGVARDTQQLSALPEIRSAIIVFIVFWDVSGSGWRHSCTGSYDAVV